MLCRGKTSEEKPGTQLPPWVRMQRLGILASKEFMSVIVKCTDHSRDWVAQRKDEKIGVVVEPLSLFIREALRKGMKPAVQSLLEDDLRLEIQALLKVIIDRGIHATRQEWQHRSEV